MQKTLTQQKPVLSSNSAVTEALESERVADPASLEALMVRQALASDVNFMISAWFRSYEKSARIPTRVYAENYPQIIKACLAHSTSLVMCAVDEPSLILAFVVGDNRETGPVLHYAYTRKGARQSGIVRRLVDTLFGHYPKLIECTARWPMSSHRYIYNPFKLGFAL